MFVRNVQIRKKAKWRATPPDSEKEDKKRQQRERRESTGQISLASIPLSKLEKTD